MNIDGVEPTRQKYTNNHPTIFVSGHQDDEAVEYLKLLYDLESSSHCVSKETLDKVRNYLKRIGKIL